MVILHSRLADGVFASADTAALHDAKKTQRNSIDGIFKYFETPK